MSLQWQLSRKVPKDTAEVGRAILKAGNVYRQIGDRFDELFPEEAVFASLYETQGRGAIPPLLMALVTVFQMLEKVPDWIGSMGCICPWATLGFISPTCTPFGNAYWGTSRSGWCLIKS